jgi:hypothetical protein
MNGQKFEIEKFHPDPLLSRTQAVTSNGSNFYRTVLILDLGLVRQREGAGRQGRDDFGFWIEDFGFGGTIRVWSPASGVEGQRSGDKSPDSGLGARDWGEAILDFGLAVLDFGL